MLTTPADLVSARALLRRETGVVLSKVTDEKLAKLLRHVLTNGGDVGVVISAVLLTNRPRWVEEIIGAWPALSPTEI